MTFLTVCEAIQLPAVARESVATMMPPWKRKASVVVPWAILMGHCGFDRSSVAERSQAEGCLMRRGQHFPLSFHLQWRKMPTGLNTGEIGGDRVMKKLECINLRE